MSTDIARRASLHRTEDDQDSFKITQKEKRLTQKFGHPACGFDSQDDSMYARAFSHCSFRELSELVGKHRGVRIDLKSPQGYQLRIAGLEGTVYWGREKMLETWERLYLPQPEKMMVIGAIDNVPSLAEGLQLIVLVDRKGKVYFYESGVLHLMAERIKDFLLRDGAKSPPIRSFKYGEFCAPKNEEEYLQIMEKAGIPLVSKATKDFVQSREKSILAHLDFL
ncbi:hypothetical protein GJAV_G00221660 [Gymnothorax javanicus]|nr:hypothetical protein GJAV_G00221660 [Gymnothorax javanicus]